MYFIPIDGDIQLAIFAELCSHLTVFLMIVYRYGLELFLTMFAFYQCVELFLMLFHEVYVIEL